MNKPVLLSVTLLLLFLLTSYTGLAQVELRLDQKLRLANSELDWIMPDDATYRVDKNPVMLYQDYDFSVRLRKENLLIRYLLVPTDTDEDINIVPHLRASAMAIHLASNEEDSYMAAHQLDPALVDSVYQADWAQTFFFQPKDQFSLASHCQMTAIYREGVALAYMFLLFEEAPARLPEYAESLRFWVRKVVD